MGIFKLNGIDYMGGGGGGNANDEELTYAEYLELTEEEKTNGTNYFITDITNLDGDFQPIVYSEEEREIGVWIDGKPLYEKTINFGTLPNNTSKTVNHNIDNIDKIVSINGIGIGPNSKPLPFVDDAAKTGDILLDASSTNIRIINHYDQSSYNGYITLQYTKTTDTPGSGQWTPQGIPAKHYSTDEQVVGTWTDGSTIYEKTFEFSSQLALNANDWTNSPAIVTGISNILDIIGYDGTAAYRLLGARPSNDTIQIFATLIIGISKITIRYTKTAS